MRAQIFVFALSIVICGKAQAELKWEHTTIELRPTPADKQAIGHFKYQNMGDKSVHFKSVRTSCGCTAAQTQNDEVPPGDKGEITATFNIGDRTGTQVKTVTVETDDLASTTTVLTLKAVIPQQLAITPTFVFWQQGEAPNPKTIGVSAAKDFPVKQFKISVQPKDTKQPIAATLTIQPEGSPKTFYATARVTTAPAINSR